MSDISLLNADPLPLPAIHPVPHPSVNLLAERSFTEHKVEDQAQDQEHHHHRGVAEKEADDGVHIIGGYLSFSLTMVCLIHYRLFSA